MTPLNTLRFRTWLFGVCVVLSFSTILAARIRSQVNGSTQPNYSHRASGEKWGGQQRWQHWPSPLPPAAPATKSPLQYLDRSPHHHAPPQELSLHNMLARWPNDRHTMPFLPRYSSQSHNSPNYYQPDNHSPTWGKPNPSLGQQVRRPPSARRRRGMAQPRQVSTFPEISWGWRGRLGKQWISPHRFVATSHRTRNRLRFRRSSSQQTCSNGMVRLQGRCMCPYLSNWQDGECRCIYGTARHSSGHCYNLLY